MIKLSHIQQQPRYKKIKMNNYQLIERIHSSRNPNGANIRVRYTFTAKDMTDATQVVTDLKRNNPRIIEPTLGRHIEFRIIEGIKYGKK